MSKSNEAKCLALVEKTIIDVPIVGNIFKTKILYKIGKKVQTWQGFVEIESGNIIDYLPNKTNPYGVKNELKAYYYTQHGQKDKKITISEKTEITKGIYKGQKNEISPVVVALNKIDTIYNNKIKSGYSDELDEITMLDFEKLYKQGKSRLFIEKFHDWNKHKKKLLGKNLVVQRKFNGTTLILVHHPIISKPYNVDAFLRGRTDFVNYDLIAREVVESLRITSGLYLIGELYLHGAYLEDISGLARLEEKSSDISSGLEYHIFDCYDINNPKLIYSDRCKILHNLFLQATTSSGLQFCKLVETFPITESNQEAQIESYFKQFLDEKYEGLIVRNLDGISMNSFNSTFRTYDIQKLKPFYDDEFKLIGFKEGKGKNKSSILFICETKEGLKFSVAPKGDMESKKALFQQLTSENGNELWKQEYEGRLYKVKFAYWSKNKKPQQPVGLGLRAESTLS